jgi:phytoene synthase
MTSPTSYCAEQVRRLDRERYLCTLFAPPQGRERLLALYAFNSEIARVRETVSEPLIGQMRLQWWREAIAELAAGKVRAHPVAQALAAAWAQSPPRPELIERLLVARELDLDDTPPADCTALEKYAEGSAAALQQATLDLLGVHDEAADRAARHIGVAWALIGHLRATPFRARQRRLYLPVDRLAAAQVEIDDVVEGRPGPGLAVVAREIAARAGEHLRAARGLRADVPRAALPSLLPAVLAEGHLRRIARTDYDLFAPELQRPLPLDVLRLAFAAWRGRY